MVHCVHRGKDVASEKEDCCECCVLRPFVDMHGERVAVLVGNNQVLVSGTYNKA